jgi:hypothetical protein
LKSCARHFAARGGVVLVQGQARGAAVTSPDGRTSPRRRGVNRRFEKRCGSGWFTRWRG